MIEFWIEQKIQGIVPCGTTGESPTFSITEQAEAIHQVVKMVNGRIPVIAGAGSNSTAEATELAQAAEKAGADALLSVAGYYNRPTQEGLFHHFRCLRGKVGLPIILYNVPCRTANNIEPDTVERIINLGGFLGIKDASGDLGYAQELLNRGIRVFSGNDELTYPLMTLGAVGVISVVANFAPTLVRQLCDLASGEQMDLLEARCLQKTMYQLSKAVFAVTNPIPVKTVMARMGWCGGDLRSPLWPMTDHQRDALLEVMKKHQII